MFFANTTYCIYESKGLVGSTLELSNPISTDINVTIRDQSGSATGKSTNKSILLSLMFTILFIIIMTFMLLLLENVDYRIATHNVTLTAGKTTMPFYIQIVNDGEMEVPEDFILTVEQTSELYDSRVTVRIGTLNQSRVIIKDDNG